MENSTKMFTSVNHVKPLAAIIESMNVEIDSQGFAITALKG